MAMTLANGLDASPRGPNHYEMERFALEKAQCTRIREASFSKNVPYNEQLKHISERSGSHSFLTNPASQNTYLYQVEFVQRLSEHYFSKPMSELHTLDWGCGKGHVTFLLRQRGACVTSCDYCLANSSDDDSAFGQDTPIIEAAGISVDRVDDPVKLPYSGDSFHVVLSFGVLEHVPDDLRSLTEIRRILRPGGILFCFNVPYYLSWTQQVAHLRGNFYHDRLYRKTTARHLLREAGYEVLDIWHRQLFPKNMIRYPFYRTFESLDQFLVRFTPLKYLATNIEFVALAH
jgi:SAM-dependent methyltransferase